ncbi:RNA-binding protein 38-like [Acropora muricata]|uniref:RNA-binding protein 38-like n=1 Tax=Acropora muricata TaxID=159855 RepID=UPI0034E4EE85
MTEDDDTKFTKLFVGGIPYHTKDETMKEYFMQFDDIVEAVIIREKNSQRSKGYGFVTMATKEGAERACVNKRPMIDGRRANVDLAYIGAKPKTPKETSQQEGTANAKCYSVPSSPTDSEQSFVMVNGTEWNLEENQIPSSFSGNVTYESVYSVYSGAPSAQALMISHGGPLKPLTAKAVQPVSPTFPQTTNGAGYYQRNSQQFSSPTRSTVSFGTNYLDYQSAVNLVTYVPQGCHVVAPSESVPINAIQRQPQFGQEPFQTAKLIARPSYLYTVPVWYVDSSSGHISFNPNYSQAPLVPAGVDLASNRMYSMPLTYN